MRKLKVLAIDDELFNLDILEEYLSDAGYEVLTAVNGEQGLTVLEAHPDIDVIVLDRMMPVMDGMTCLKALKSNPSTRDIPVIMQTAATSHTQIREGIEGGVFYYLTKPYDERVFLSLVRTALEDVLHRQTLLNAIRQSQDGLKLITSGTFQFRTLDEARSLALVAASCFPDSDRVVYGLSELLINAVEHGNLGITYAEKTRLVLNGEWQKEVERRLSLPEYKGRLGSLEIENTDTLTTATIKDCGEGFAFASYLELSTERATDPHGRGIATARLLSFDRLEYSPPGNIVHASIKKSHPISGNADS